MTSAGPSAASRPCSSPPVSESGHQPLGAGDQRLPDPVLEPGGDGDELWLHQRVRHTHNLWHVVSGCPPSPPTPDPGETALSVINVMHRCLE